MDEKKIARINQLAAKAKTPEGLTQEEREEQLRLRREYIDSVVGHLAWELVQLHNQRNIRLVCRDSHRTTCNRVET